MPVLLVLCIDVEVVENAVGYVQKMRKLTLNSKHPEVLPVHPLKGKAEERRYERGMAGHAGIGHRVTRVDMVRNDGSCPCVTISSG